VAGLGFDRPPSVEFLDPGAHRIEPEAVCTRVVEEVDVEPAAVVDDIEVHGVGTVGEGDDTVARIGVTSVFTPSIRPFSRPRRIGGKRASVYDFGWR